MNKKNLFDSFRRQSLFLIVMAVFVLIIAGASHAEDTCWEILSGDQLNLNAAFVDKGGKATVYLNDDPRGLIGNVANANDNRYSVDKDCNLMTITGKYLGIQIALAEATNLIELGAYVDPSGYNSDPYKNTDAVWFFTSTDGGATYGPGIEGTFEESASLNGYFFYVYATGNFNDVTHIRYLFHQSENGSEGQRIPEVLAFQVCDQFADWKNHGQFVRCVAQEIDALVEQGILTEDEGDAFIRTAAQSDIGKH